MINDYYKTSFSAPLVINSNTGILFSGSKTVYCVLGLLEMGLTYVPYGRYLTLRTISQQIHQFARLPLILRILELMHRQLIYVRPETRT